MLLTKIKMIKIEMKIKIKKRSKVWYPSKSPDAPDRVRGHRGDGGTPVGTKARGHLRFSRVNSAFRNLEELFKDIDSDRERPEEPHLLPGHLPVVLLPVDAAPPVVDDLPVVLGECRSPARVLLPRHQSRRLHQLNIPAQADVHIGGHRDGAPHSRGSTRRWVGGGDQGGVWDEEKLSENEIEDRGLIDAIWIRVVRKVKMIGACCEEI